MAKYEVIVPKLGESVIEATITKWLKNEGETVQEDEPLVEIATDKVDSEITSPVSGVLKQKVSEAGSVVPVGKVFAILETGTELIAESQPVMLKVNPFQQEVIIQPDFVQKPVSGEPVVQPSSATGTRFYSPLVRSIAQQEGLSFSELDNIPGTGKDDRITKHDLLNFLKDKQSGKKQDNIKADSPEHIPVVIQQVIPGEDSIVEMNRIRLLIATHMVKSVQTAPHVTSFMEVDMTRIVQWRDQNKDGFQKRENEKLTFTPIFMEAIAKGVRDFPMINVSVDGTKIIVHSNVNIGMAVALPNFNLIVPVVRNAHEKNLLGIVKTVNDLAERARLSKLLPDEITGGTISLTNLGSFGTIMGTPIINQPQSAIIAVGAIRKKPVVIETSQGDSIAIRSMMIISVTYDHRVIDGSLGGKFLSRIVHHLETFDTNQPI